MAINSYPDNSGGEVKFPDQLIDPVSKFRVSNPENLIDTDFEYGLQPTKWETVELINNTPSFFSKSGDTTIDGISSITTNAQTREIIVKTELDHGLAVGIPINVTGTKSITADGAYIINSIPDPKTFTYLCKDLQQETNSILDLYSSIITGEFFQGSQLRISDSEGVVTNASGTSILTVTTNTTHGFGENTPFYFLNLNSTVAQEFQAANTASKSFDASNSATAQTFDASNSLSSVSIDWSNSATFGGTPSTVSATSLANDTVTVTHTGENFNNLPLGTPLYYSVSSTGGYFNTNPRGVVFLKTVNQLGTLTSTFQVSLVPNGDPVNLTENLSGSFQVANQARTFAGNNINPLTQTVIDVEVGAAFDFDGSNQGYAGVVLGSPPSSTLTVLSYTGTAINADGPAVADYYVGAMVKYSSSGTVATGLAANATYFIKTFTDNTSGNYTFTIAELPTGNAISISGGTGTQIFEKIGVSIDKDIVHVKDSNFAKDDMLEYIFPVDGRFSVNTEAEEKIFYFVDTVYDSHNYKLSEEVGFKPVVATGGNVVTETFIDGRVWKNHIFTSTGSSNFVVTDVGKESLIQYFMVAGGGAGGSHVGGGGGAGGVRQGSFTVSATTYPVVVGAGGTNTVANTQGGTGGNTTAFGVTANGGGGGGSWAGNGNPNGTSGGSGGGAGSGDGSTTGTGGAGTAGQGFAGGNTGPRAGTRASGAGGGGASQVGESRANSSDTGKRNGGNGVTNNWLGTTYWFAGGGGSGSFNDVDGGNGGRGGGGGGAKSDTASSLGLGNTESINPAGNGGIFGGNKGGAGAVNSGGGGGGGPSTSSADGGSGGSGIAIIRYPVTADPQAGSFILASGGEVSTMSEGGIRYAVHRFRNTGSNSFVVTNASNSTQNNLIQYLIVAGGGAGGAHVGGGGGAGGVIQGTFVPTAQTYSLTVGAGGTATGGETRGNNGSNSIAFGLTAIGGGGGGTYGGVANPNGLSGGSGGGGGGTNEPNQSGTGGSGTLGQGFAGGTVGPRVGQTNTSGAGGGGAGGAALNRTNAFDNVRRDGADGIFVSWLNAWFGGGGGSGTYLSVAAGNGGKGGGGGGSSTQSTAGLGDNSSLFGASSGSSGGGAIGGAGAPNSGGGGGGGAGGSTAASTAPGGSGIIVVRYPIGVV